MTEVVRRTCRRRSVAISALIALVALLAFADAGGAAGATTELPATRMPWPISSVKISQRFQMSGERWNAGHRGVDVRAELGGELRSPLTGHIRFAGVVNDRPVLSLERNDGLIVTLEPVNSTLLAGDVVNVGDSIGSVGLGGHCNSKCLHVGVIAAGDYVSPLRYFELPFARLLPER